MGNIIKRCIVRENKSSKNNILLAVIIIVIVLLMSFVRPGKFLTWNNINSMLLQTSEIGLLSLGMIIAFLVGGIDLSVVSNAVLSATVAGFVMKSLAPSGVILAIISGVAVSLAVGTLLGMINGLIISKIKMPPILATLGTNSLFRGIAVGLTGGSTLGGFPEQFAAIGNGELGGIYYAFLIFVLVSASIGIMFEKSSFGFKCSILGRNEKASFFSGINNEAVTLRAYSVIGLIAGIAGIVMMSRANSINPDYGSSYLLQTILVCVIAGVNIDGGEAKASGLLLAVILMQVISTSFNMLLIGYSGATFFKNIVWGVLLIGIMLVKLYSENGTRLKSKAGKQNGS